MKIKNTLLLNFILYFYYLVDFTFQTTGSSTDSSSSMGGTTGQTYDKIELDKQDSRDIKPIKGSPYSNYIFYKLELPNDNGISPGTKSNDLIFKVKSTKLEESNVYTSIFITQVILFIEFI